MRTALSLRARPALSLHAAVCSLTVCMLAVSVGGCVVNDPIGATQAEVAIPGPWVAPARVQAIASTLYVPVVDPPPVRPAGSCASTNPFACSCTHPACTPAHPGTTELREYLLARFGGVRNSGTYCCRQNSNSRSNLSVHAIGRAIDLGVREIGGDADNTVGDEVANFLVEHAEYIGIQRVIWDYSFWNGERGFGRLGGNPHTDHLHIELSQAGARRETLFFTRGAPGTTCAEECVGDVLIHADCAQTDCGATGAPCLPGPPAVCGEPPPPEPPEATLVDGAAFPALSAVGDPGRLTFTGPDRLFDTRESSAGLTFDASLGELTWASGLPAAVEGVWLNLAAVATAPGFVTAFPTGSPRPGTSNINTSGRVRANLVPTPLGENQSITFYEREPVELIGDVYATMGAAGDGLELIDPTRVYDSRSLDAPLAAMEVREIDVGAPEGATGVLGSVVAIEPIDNAHLSVFPCGADPEASTVNVLASEVASAQVVSALGPTGTLCVRALRDMHVVLDVLGYFSPGGLLEYQALTPTRLVDTRTGVYFQNRLGARQTIELPLGTAEGMPENGWAAVLNVATLEADGRGFVAAFACERGEPPNTSAHNFDVDVRATLVTSDLGTSRRACLHTSTRAHVIVDLLGIWRRRDGAPPPPPEPTPNPVGEPGPQSDGGLVDGGASRESVDGCACRAAPSAPSPLGGLALLGLALALWRRRR